MSSVDQSAAVGNSNGGANEAAVNTQTKAGMNCDIKNLYQFRDEDGYLKWTEKYPAGLNEPPENARTALFAILVRNRKTTNPRKKLETEDIVVQSPLLKKVLHELFHGYPGATTGLERQEFKSPFKPFVHKWDSLCKLVEDEKDDTTKSHLQLLHQFLSEELKEALAVREEYISKKIITFHHLWMIFSPGCSVYSMASGHESLTIFQSGRYEEVKDGQICYSIRSIYLDWDGEKFGYGCRRQDIDSFGGAIPFAKLDCSPLKYHPEKEKIWAKLVRRGRLFEAYAGYHYKSYNSIALGSTFWGTPTKTLVNSRIIIDRGAYNKFHPNSEMSLMPFKSPLKSPLKSDSKSNDDTDDSDDKVLDQNSTDKAKPKDSTVTSPVSLLKDSEVVYASSMVKGYSLKTKSWLDFYVDEVTDIQWDSDAFDSLVLPADQKELILAFAESQIKYKDSFDDVISGKGKGIILLLSGGPGIGKTLTAESVAEEMKAPLYVMAAGDLGSDSECVESSLATILEMVTKWNAVLLLDECDVFLEARSSHDLKRNQIVSVFLRVLEYYEGILFLTTNRADNMDAAFQSRIHVNMQYPALDASARTKVWRNFLSRGINHELSDEDINKLAAIDINGRVIKNVLKTSQLLACHKQVPLRYEHLQTVLSIQQPVQKTSFN